MAAAADCLLRNNEQARRAVDNTAQLLDLLQRLMRIQRELHSHYFETNGHLPGLHLVSGRALPCHPACTARSLRPAAAQALYTSVIAQCLAAATRKLTFNLLVCRADASVWVTTSQLAQHARGVGGLVQAQPAP